MKKVFLLILSIALIMGVANAQSDSCVEYSYLKRMEFRLNGVYKNADNVLMRIVLGKKELQPLLSEEQFEDYNIARRCYIASVPLLISEYVVFVAGIWAMLQYDPNAFLDFNILVGLAFWGVSFLISAPEIASITYSAKEINKIAKDYNNQRYSSYYQRNIQLNFGFTQNGIGFKLSF
jgi:hypothetical protein